MVKNFIHILRTYLITFRYLKKNEINHLSSISFFFICLYLTLLMNLILVSII